MRLTVKCKKCSSEAIRPSTLRYWEPPLNWIHPFTPFRCLSCNTRFYKPDVISRLDHIRRYSILILVFFTMIGFIFFVLRPNTSKLQLQSKKEASNNATDKSPPRDIAIHSAPPITVQAPTATITPIGSIRMKQSVRFMVNWIPERDGGLRITRISDGPFAQAGILVGDILVSINDIPLKNEDALLKIRNEIHKGRTNSAILQIRRQNNQLFFTLKN